MYNVLQVDQRVCNALLTHETSNPCHSHAVGPQSQDLTLTTMCLELLSERLWAYLRCAALSRIRIAWVYSNACGRSRHCCPKALFVHGTLVWYYHSCVVGSVPSSASRCVLQHLRGHRSAKVSSRVHRVQDMRRAHSANLPVVEVHVGASKFKTSSSSKMKSLTSLFAAGRGKGIRNPEPLVKCSSDPHSESPRCIRLGAASADDGASPRLWPTSVHAAAQRSELEQPSNGACLNPDQFRRISDVVASADDSMDAAHDQEAQQRHCGFGSPIAGLIRTDSPATTRQSPRHYETYTVDESANDDSVEKALQKSVDTCNRCIGAERDTGAGLGQESDAGPGIARYKGSSMLHVDTGTEGNRASNAELNIHENRAGFDPSALSAMPELPPPKHIEQESSCKENLKRSRSNLSMTVDFMDILWAWQRNDLNGRDVNMVADSIMKGLKHHCKRS